MKTRWKEVSYVMKYVKAVVCSLVFCILLIECKNDVLAAQQSQVSAIPTSIQRGSIQVTMQDAENQQKVSGGTLTCIKVGTLENQQEEPVWKFTEAFADCGLNIEQMQEETFADRLWDYAQKKSIERTTKQIDQNGTVMFDDIPLGVYLIVQQKPAEGYYKVKAFVVSVPFEDKNTWIYDVDASPKMEKLKKTTTTSGKKENTKIQKLPQTGQMNWPIPLLACSGMILFLAGWRIYKKGKESEF